MKGRLNISLDVIDLDNVQVNVHTTIGEETRETVPMTPVKLTENFSDMWDEIGELINKAMAQDKFYAALGS